MAWLPPETYMTGAWPTPGRPCRPTPDAGLPLDPDAGRLAFADPEFLLRRETRGIRFQLELLKPDLEQQRHGHREHHRGVRQRPLSQRGGSGRPGGGGRGRRRRSAGPARPGAGAQFPLLRKGPRLRQAGRALQRGQGPGGHAFHLHRRRPGHHAGRQPRRLRGRTASASACRSPCRWKKSANPYVTPALSLQVPLLRAAQDALHDAREGAGRVSRAASARWTSCSR